MSTEPLVNSEKMTVNIKTTKGKKVSVNVAKTCTVKELKDAIEVELPESPSSCQRLIYKGRVMKDKDTCSSYGLEDGQMVIVVAKRTSSAKKASVPSTSSTAAPSTANPSSNTNPGTQPNPAAAQANPLAAMFQNMGQQQQGAANPMANPMMGAMGNPAMMQGMMQDPAMMQNMLQNPMVQQMMTQLSQNPQMMRQMIQSNPMLSQMAQNNPQLQMMLQNPQMMQMMFNPQVMQAAVGMNAAMRQQQGQNAANPSAPNPQAQANPFAAMFAAPPAAAQPAAASTDAPAASTENAASTSAPAAAATASQPNANPQAAAANPFMSLFNNPAMMQQMAAMQGQQQGQMGAMPGMFGMQQPNAQNNAAMGQNQLQQARLTYGSQLSQLNSMGFSDDDRNIQALIATGGNIQAAINRLLS